MCHEKIILSIVIPHYNVEQYIDCLYGILFPQITEKVEVLLIEDCSTDDTKIKMREWEEKIENPSISFIYLGGNLGLSGARNKGTSLAQGEYLWFVDSDDSIEADTVQTILNIIQKLRPDGIVFDFYKFDGDHGECNQDNQLTVKRSKYRSLEPNKVNEDNEVLIQALFDDAQMYTWCYVLKKELWERFPFPEGRKFEDVATMPKIMYSIESLYYLSEPLYYYRQRENSILSCPTVASCLNMVEAMRDVSHYFEDRNLPEVSRMSLYTFYLRMLRLFYGDLREYNLLSKETLHQYQEEENYFFNILPWNKYQFIQKMQIYPMFKFTSLLFVSNKKIYAFVKNLLGKY